MQAMKRRICTLVLAPSLGGEKVYYLLPAIIDQSFDDAHHSPQLLFLVCFISGFSCASVSGPICEIQSANRRGGQANGGIFFVSSRNHIAVFPKSATSTRRFGCVVRSAFVVQICFLHP
jgi:hypothetical protein